MKNKSAGKVIADMVQGIEPYANVDGWIDVVFNHVVSWEFAPIRICYNFQCRYLNSKLMNE